MDNQFTTKEPRIYNGNKQQIGRHKRYGSRKCVYHEKKNA